MVTELGLDDGGDLAGFVQRERGFGENRIHVAFEREFTQVALLFAAGADAFLFRHFAEIGALFELGEDLFGLGFELGVGEGFLGRVGIRAVLVADQDVGDIDEGGSAEAVLVFPVELFDVGIGDLQGRFDFFRDVALDGGDARGIGVLRHFLFQLVEGLMLHLELFQEQVLLVFGKGLELFVDHRGDGFGRRFVTGFLRDGQQDLHLDHFIDHLFGLGFQGLGRILGQIFDRNVAQLFEEILLGDLFVADGGEHGRQEGEDFIEGLDLGRSFGGRGRRFFCGLGFGIGGIGGPEGEYGCGRQGGRFDEQTLFFHSDIPFHGMWLIVRFHIRIQSGQNGELLFRLSGRLERKHRGKNISGPAVADRQPVEAGLMQLAERQIRFLFAQFR